MGKEEPGALLKFNQSSGPDTVAQVPGPLAATMPPAKKLPGLLQEP